MPDSAVVVNGTARELTGIQAHENALDWIRSLGLTGAKEGCAEGECGACAVLVSRPGTTTASEWVAVNACLLPALALAGQEVVTAEGLADGDELHPVQHELAVRGGSQCGYCTPGFVCSMAAEYYRPDRLPAPPPAPPPGSKEQFPTPSPIESALPDTGEALPIERALPDTAGGGPGGDVAAGDAMGANGFDLHALSGNLCRCTGYRPIRDAAFALGTATEDRFVQRTRTTSPAPRVRIRSGDSEFARPDTLAEALHILQDRPDAVVVAGCTDWGVEVNLRGARTRLVVAVDRLAELRQLDLGGAGTGEGTIDLGAALTLTELERHVSGRVPLLGSLLPQFASRLIRNTATMGGNLATASPIGDCAPALLALDARVVLVSVRGEREVALAEYFTGYRTTVREPDELIRLIRVPVAQPRIAAFHKIAKRRFDDISSTAVAIAVDVAEGVVERARIGLGGVATTPLRAQATEAALIGRPWDSDHVEAAARVLVGEGTPMSDHRASADYRAAMLGNALRRTFAEQTRGEPAGQAVGS